VRSEIEFTSSGTVCRGWLDLPQQTQADKPPLVIMAHGFGATRDMLLEPYAERFNAAGMATLIFDYRHFGASDGEPRQLLSPWREVRDWQAAIEYARRLDSIDAGRIALWGTSYAGGLVVMAAAREPDIAAIVCQCPLMDGRAAVFRLLRYAGPGALLRMSAHGLLDTGRALLGLSPHYIPIVSAPGTLGAMTTEDAYEKWPLLATPDFRNEVTARTGLYTGLYRPIRHARKVHCPALVQICDLDSVAPAEAAERATRRMPRGEAVHYPVGHFDVYLEQDFERSVADQLDFLCRHLAPDFEAG